MMRNSKSLQERFESKYIPEPMSGCWLWTAHSNHLGYGAIRAGRENDFDIPAHRASWLLYRGEIPKDLFVLHKCDVPSCVNPHHLFLGTQKANMEDMANKKRHANTIKTHCANGHEYNEKNTRLKNNQRICISCTKVWDHKKYLKRKERKSQLPKQR